MSRAPVHFAAGSAMLLLAAGPAPAQQQGWFGSGARTSGVVSTPDVKAQPAEGWFGRERRTEAERRARAAEAAPDLEISAGVGAASMPPPGEDYPVLTAEDAAPQSPPQPEAGPMATAASEPQLLGGPDATTSAEAANGADGAPTPWLRQGGVANYSVQREARVADADVEVPPPILVDPQEAARAAAAANPPRRRALPPPPRSTAAIATPGQPPAPEQTSGRFGFSPGRPAATPADDRPKDQGEGWRFAGFGVAARPAPPPLPQAQAPLPQTQAPSPQALAAVGSVDLAIHDQAAAAAQAGGSPPAEGDPRAGAAAPAQAARSLTHPPQRARRTTTVLRTFTSPDEVGG